jgi:hypothetical protein
MTEYDWEPLKNPVKFGAVARIGVVRIGSMPVKVRRHKGDVGSSSISIGV